MSGSPQGQALAIENVEFVKHDESKRRSAKKKKKRSDSDEPLLSTPPMSSPRRELPLYDEEKGEMNPLLDTSPNRRGYMVPQQYGPPYQQPPGAGYYGQGPEYNQGGYEYAYNGQQPSSPSQVYPQMMPNAAMYYDQMGGAPIHPLSGQQQSPQQQSPQSPYRQQQVPSSQSQQTQQQVWSPLGGQRRKSYHDSPDGPSHPLKKPTQGEEEYEIPLRDSGPEQSYGAIPDPSAPPRSSRSRSSRPPRRKSETPPPGQRPPSPISRAHRRVSSDSAKQVGRHRRVSSDLVRVDQPDAASGKHRRSSSDRLPPTGLARVRKSLPFTAHNRRRSFSGSSGGGARTRPTHTRGSSFSEISVGASVATSTSMVSHVTDISKSAFFGGATKEGKVQLHFPFENVRLTTDDALPTGVLYMRHVDEEQYEDYHIFNEEHDIPWELDGELPCQCTCLKCIGCTERNQQLAPSKYIMTVEDDLYRRVLDEISASRTMPCGCFFCGHHEDVDSPSILIAGTIVFLFIMALMIGTIMLGA